MILEKEIYRLAELYRISKEDTAKSCYDNYVDLIIEDAPKEKRRELSEMYERLKENKQ